MIIGALPVTAELASATAATARGTQPGGSPCFGRLAVCFSINDAIVSMPPRSAHWYAAGAGALSSGAYVRDVELAPAIIQDLLTTVGTRGDVQPYIAIARALMARGHEVTLAVSDDHAPLVRAYGVAHRSMRGNFRELLQTDLGRAWLTSEASPLEYVRYARELFLPMQRMLCEDADAAVEGADGVVFYAMAMHAMHAAERRKLPMAMLAPWPIIPSGEIAPVTGAVVFDAPGFVKKLA